MAGSEKTDNKPMLSICIPTYNRDALLEKLLEHLEFTNDWPFSTEIIVADNASEDRTAQVIEAAKQRLPTMRSIRQTHNNGPKDNVLSAYLQARGKYTLYLADDDFLAPDNLATIIEHMEGTPGLGICHAPWTLEYSDGSTRPFYQVKEILHFDQSQSLDCFNFILQSHVFPEIAVYRTDVLHRIMYYPRRTFVCFVWLFKALQCGSVCFHPSSFYRSPVRPDGGVGEGRSGQIGHTHAIEYMDQYRAGLEAALFMALQDKVPLPLPEPIRSDALSMINGFMLDRFLVAGRLTKAKKDFIGAVEFETRALLWRKDAQPGPVEQWEQKNLLIVCAQAMVELFNTDTNLDSFVVAGFVDPEAMLACLKFIDPDFPLICESLDDVLNRPQKNGLMVLTATEEHRAALVESGMLPGRVLWIEDVILNYKIMPRAFADGDP